MSRAAEQDVANTASGESKVFNTNAQTSFENANNSLTDQQNDIGQYQNQLSQFAAANPYGAGGAYQTAVNQSTAGGAAGAGASASQGAQAAAVRGGLNSGAGVAAGDKTEEQNTRDLMTTQADANAGRISKGASYGQQVLQASQVPATLQGAVTGEQGRLASEEGGLGVQSLGVDQKASDEPSFWDTLGESYAKAQGAGLGGGMQALAAAGG